MPLDQDIEGGHGEREPGVEIGVCSGYVYMPCMAYTRLSQVPDYAKLLPQTLLSA